MWSTPCSEIFVSVDRSVRPDSLFLREPRKKALVQYNGIGNEARKEKE